MLGDVDIDVVAVDVAELVCDDVAVDGYGRFRHGRGDVCANHVEDAIGRPRGDDLRWVFRESTDEDEIVEQKTIRKPTRTTTRGVASYVEGRERKCASRPE